jgi:hypothetical protein
MSKSTTIHIRRKAPKDAPLYCGGARCNDQTKLKSVGPQQADKGNCQRCQRAKGAADRDRAAATATD